jgi:hypothetical protein
MFDELVSEDQADGGAGTAINVVSLGRIYETSWFSKLNFGQGTTSV